MTGLPALRMLDPDARAQVLRQDAVATVLQLRAWGLGRSRISHRVLGGEWQRLFPGVVVLQSGPVTWRQTARAALLYSGRQAALSHRSAAFQHGVVDDPGRVVVVSVPHSRTVTGQPGLDVRRRRQMPWAGGRLRSVAPEQAVLDVVSGLTGVDEVVGLLCDAVRRGVPPARVLEALENRSRFGNRVLVLDVLGAVAEGIESPLEHRYRRDVERAHGLPVAQAQVRERVGGRWIRADRLYRPFGVRVELDGQLAHPSGSTDADVWRDNAVRLSSGDLTLRYRWRHVTSAACATAIQVASALNGRGWTGRPRPCGPACPVGRFTGAHGTGGIRRA